MRRCAQSCSVCEAVKKYDLTPTEIYVLCLTAKHGLTNGKIARVLTCTEGTVRNHNMNINRKIGTGTKLEMALWAIARGVVRV